jgi:hypothetical protein
MKTKYPSLKPPTPHTVSYASIICYFSDEKIYCSDFGLDGMSSCLRPPSLKSKFSCFLFSSSLMFSIEQVPLLYCTWMPLRVRCTFFRIVPPMYPETHRLATQHTCLACPGCWAMGTNKVKKCTVRKIIFSTGPRQDKNLLYRHDESNEPTKEGPLSFVRFESPFT